MLSTSRGPAALNQEVPDIPSITTTSDTYAHELYCGVLEEREVEGYLQGSCDYDTNQTRWSIPQATTTTENLVNSFYTILSSIVRHFVKSTEPGVERVLDNTYGTPECEEKNDKGYRVCPVLVLQATGPSFQIPEPIQPSTLTPSRSIGYSQMTSFFSVKPEKNVGNVEEEVDKMSTYARRVLRSQPNRFFVRCMVLTERYARLIHFDRAGAEITPPIDIHQHPSTLVRLIAGLGSTDERILGIDTSIQWNIVNGRKEKGVVTTTGPTGKARTYPILERLRTSRDSIYGRATTCWRVQDPDTLEEFVIKESWRLDGRQGEHELLEVVKGIPGVAQMVSYEAGRGEIKDFRCPTTIGRYQNRIAARVLLKSYGPSIENFTSILQVLYGLRDAIVGHQSLTADSVRVLHRDVSVFNVLRGRANAPVGERGVLIDLDLAFRATESKPTAKVDYNIGIRIFQPLSTLGSMDMEAEAPAHDYLDDLESFFYLLTYILLLYRPDGSRLPTTDEGPSILWTFAEEDATLAYTNKEMLFGSGRVNVRTSRLIQASWGSICGNLFENFREFTQERRSDKEQLRYEGKGPESLFSRRTEHYSAVLGILDGAIEAFRPSYGTPTFNEPAAEEAPLRPPTAPLTTTLTHPNNPSSTPPPPLQTVIPSVPPAPSNEVSTTFVASPRDRGTLSVYPSHKRPSGDDDRPSPLAPSFDVLIRCASSRFILVELIREGVLLCTTIRSQLRSRHPTHPEC